MPQTNDPYGFDPIVSELAGIRRGDTVSMATNPTGSTITALVKSLHPDRKAIVVKLDGSTVYLLVPVSLVLSIIRHP